jgi:HK97 family phage prohead protease
MTEELQRASQDSVEAKGEGRTIDVRLAAWDDIAENTMEGYKEQLVRGVFEGTDPERVTLEAQRHGGALVGVAESIEERDDGAYGSFRIADTPAGNELLELVRSKVLRDASVVFRPGKSKTTAQGIVQRLSAELRRVAILERGAYPSASVLAVRSELVSEETPPVVEEAAPPAADLSPIVERVDALDERLAKLATINTIPGQGSPDEELFRHESLADYTAAVWKDKSAQDMLPEYLMRAASEQETANNPGVLPPSWVRDVKRIVNLGRRAISSFGTTPLPATGTTVSWPYLNSSNTLIATQTEVDEAQTAQVDIAQGDGTLETWAGYSMISYQLLQRSDPSYREAYNRIILADWAARTDAAWCADLEGTSGTTTQVAGAMLGANVTLANPSAASDDIIDTSAAHGFSNGDAIVFTALTGGTGVTAGQVYWVIADTLAAQTFKFSATPGGAAVDFSTNITAGTVAKVTDTGAKFRAALAQASVSVEDATGMPAGICLVGTDMFLMLAGLSGFQSTQPAGNVSASDGTMLASTLRMESSGLLVQRAPGVSNGKAIISNQSAATWMEQGPRFVTAEDVSQMGQYVGVYSFAVPAVYVPAGVVELTLI